MSKKMTSRHFTLDLLEVSGLDKPATIMTFRQTEFVTRPAIMTAEELLGLSCLLTEWGKAVRSGAREKGAHVTTATFLANILPPEEESQPLITAITARQIRYKPIKPIILNESETRELQSLLCQWKEKLAADGILPEKLS